MFVMSTLSVFMVGIGALGLYGFNHSNLRFPVVLPRGSN